MVVPEIRVLVLDAYEIERAGLRTVLGDQKGISMVGESGDMGDAVKLAVDLQPSVLVIDIAERYTEAYEIVRLVGSRTDARCLAFSDAMDWHSVAGWLKAGGRGYIPKCASSAEIAHGIQRVAQGEIYVSPLVRAAVPTNQPADSANLSPRERGILVLVAMGFTSPEISERLCISRRTVENHRDRIRRKLGIRNRAEFVQYVVEQGLFERR